MERTLILVKPDGVQRGLVGEIIARLEKRGLKIVALKMLHLDKAMAKKHYAVHDGKPFFTGLVDYITSSPIVAMAIEGKNAVEAVRQTMGKTNCLQAAPGTIRADFGLGLQNNLVHGSDSPENAVKEISLFFASSEIVSYAKDVDRWITES